MKTVSLTMAMLLFIINCHAQKFPKVKEVPQSVLAAAQKQYAQVHIKKWEKRNDNFVAYFSESRRKQYAFFSADGAWIKTETKIPWSRDLPPAVKNSFGNTVFISWYIDEMKEVSSPGKDMYVIQVHHNDGPDGAIPGDNDNVYKLSFNPDGSLIKKEHKE